MDANAKAIWTNRALNFVAGIGVAVSALAAAAAEIGGVAEKLQALGVVPAKWASTAAAIAILGHFAAKYSKTPSQAIAAAVPPGKAPAPPPAGILPLIIFAILLASAGAAHANWGTSSAMPVNLSNACLYDTDYDADVRGMQWICTWSPDVGETGWNDTAGRRGDRCIGDPLAGDVDVITTSGKYCTRVHGFTSTDAAPNGFHLGWQYMLWVGFYGVDMDNWWSDEQIGSYRLGPNSHATFCAGDLSGTAVTPCQASSSRFVRTDTTIGAGALSFIPYSLTVGTNAVVPPVCQLAPRAFIACPGGRHASGLPIFLGGDGQPRAGGLAIIGNPITGGSGAPCLSRDQNGQVAVAVYPVPGPATTNPDGTAASASLCP